MNTETIETTATETAPCERTVDINIPATTVKDALTAATKKYKSQVNVPGFRPGKTPDALIRKRFATRIKQDVREQLMMMGIQKAVERSEAQMEVMPSIVNQPGEVDDAQAFSFSIKFDVAPEFELPEYKSIPVNSVPTTVEDEALEEYLESLRAQRPNYEPVDREAEEGDLLRVRYRTEVEGEVPETAQRLVESEENWIELQTENEVFPGACGKLVGHKAEDTVELSVTFPDDHNEPFVAGKTLDYTFDIVEVVARTIPELNDEFAVQLGVESVEALRNAARERMVGELESLARRGMEGQICDYLLERVEFDLPPQVMSGEKEYRLSTLKSQRGDDGQENSNCEHDEDQGEPCCDDEREKEQKLDAEAQEAAERSVRLRYLFREIAKVEGVEVDPQQVEMQIDAARRQAELRKQPFREEYVRNVVESNTLMDQTMTRLIELAEVTEVEKKDEAGDEASPSEDAAGDESSAS